MSIDRRNFLKLSSLAAVGISASASLTLFSCDHVFDSGTTLIPHASHWGPFKAVIKNGKLIGVQPLKDIDAMPNEMLTKGLMSRVYDKTRVMYPMVRKSFFEGRGSNTKSHLRGKEPFIRITWSEALTLVADSIIQVIKKHGNESIFSSSYGGWSHAGFIRPNVLQGRFFGLIGGHSITKGDYSAGAAQVVLPHIIGDMETYSPQSSWKTIYDHTEVFVLIGCDPWKNNRLEYRVADHQMYPNWIKFKEKGIRFISINPHRTNTDKKMDAEWIRITPNTDTALFLAMSYHIYINNLHDKAYLDKYTVGLDKFVAYLLGRDADGTPPKTPQWAQSITGIKAEKIVELAELFANSKTQFAPSWAIQRADHGELAHWAIINFVAMLGKIGKPGEGVGFSFHYGNGGTLQSGKSMPLGLSQGRNPIDKFCPASRIIEMLENPGASFYRDGTKYEYPDAKLIYNSGNNFMSHQPDTNRLIKALNKQVETIICQDPWWCASAQIADIVLPATSTLERNGLTSGGTYSNDKIYAMRKLIDPIGESLDDFEIFRRLAYIFDVEEGFTEGKNIMQIIRASYEKSDATMPFEEFWEKGITTLPVPKEAEQFVRHGDFYTDPVNNKLHTKSGKIELYCQTFAEFDMKKCPPIPKFLEPFEFLGNAREGQLHIVSPHPNMRLHSQMANSEIREKENVQGRQHVLINPIDAKARHIEDGDLIEIYNERGASIAGARISEDIRSGVLALEEGNWLRFDSKGRCNNGSINILTSSEPSSELSQATTANTCLVYARKCTDAEENTAYEPPFIIEDKYFFTPQSLGIASQVEQLKSKFSEADMEPGERIYYRSCSVCHAPQNPKSFTKKQWYGIIASMKARAGLKGEDEKLVMEYVKKNAKKDD
ncbi:trimethylamine-N-oxide reductase (cytochrome c) [Saccharicrinis carchari]|uniref:Trimethylamine-N-oxide reductase (Cytochrome c) n=1 Tax=Saccharicrinis carchari TaxID=1168039 RepID=A0A521D0G9_SACCC|nr:molybdopterin-dependent oxidoreductase [Saccharicrinis carchari]SMO64390.1 trimethylamine-N-oxide reductase (cytochrome c) [Saccharicrinis carchari]